MVTMSNIIDFWASRLGGRHELDRSQVIDDVLAWGKAHGADLSWAEPIIALTEIRFYTSKSYSVIRYVRKFLVIGGIVELTAECVSEAGRVSDSFMGTLAHELWHAYVDSFVEKGPGLEAGISDLFGAAITGLRGQVPDGSLHEAADELVGNYLGLCVDRLRLIRSATTDAMAQRLWSELASENWRTVDLSGREYPNIAAVLKLSEDVARRLRVVLLGLSDDVAAWPVGARTWLK